MRPRGLRGHVTKERGHLTAWPKVTLQMDEPEGRNSSVGNTVNTDRDPGTDLPLMSALFPYSYNPSTNQENEISPAKNQNSVLVSFNLA